MALPARCRIVNISDAPILSIDKSHPDNEGSRGKVRYARKIEPKGRISLCRRKCNLNGTNCRRQIKIHLVAAEIPADGGKAYLKKPRDAVYSNGIGVDTVEMVRHHNELKAKMYIACGERGEVMEVTDESRITEYEMNRKQNKKWAGSIRGFFRRIDCWKSGRGAHGTLSNGQVASE